MGKLIVTLAGAAAIGALALAIFLRFFPNPDRTTVAIALAPILVALAPIGMKLLRDLKKVYVPPKD